MASGPARVLLVDDDDGIRIACGEALQQAGFAVHAVATGNEALQAFAQEPFDAAVLDLVLPDTDGLTLLEAIHEADPEAVVVLMTGYATLEAAIEAVRRGAYDFLRKPFSVMDLTRVVSHGLERRGLAVRNRELVQELDQMNQDLRHQVQAATDELTAFLNLGRRLSTGPLPLLREMLRACLQLTTARSGAVCRLLPSDPGTDPARLTIVAAEGDAAADLRALQVSADEALLRRCLQTLRPVIVPELLADVETATGAFALLGLSSAMVVPLLAMSGCVGVMTLFDPAQPFTDRQASLVKVLGAQAAEVVAQADLRGAVVAGETEGEFVDLQDILSARRQP